MNNKIKKSKKKHKELEEIEDFSKEKEILKDSDDNSDDQTNSSNGNIEQNINKKKHIKFIKKKKVKFGDIEVIDVECWKEMNLKLTSEENVDELIKITEGKSYGRIKNIGCTCLIM